jgi:hypothetical protein
MPQGHLGFVRPRAIVLGAALAAVAATAVGPALGRAAGFGATLDATTALVPQIHAFPTLSHKADCFPPVIVSVACGGAGTPMTYGNGPVETAPAVYIVYWGWHNSDPSGQGPYQEAFFGNVGGSTWNAGQTQYCQGATNIVGTACSAGSTPVGNPAGVLKGTWHDDTNAVPSSPGDADIRAEAKRAADFFGNTTPASNASVEYVIDTPHGNSTSGFNTQWCAYHGWAPTADGNLSYTDFPYQTDAGANCGQNFVNSGSAGLLDGVSIVGGHEFAESETDPDTAGGWYDTTGAETGDKCAWIQFGPGTAVDISLGGRSFAVQSLWSNSANSGAGGCVTFYAGAGNQH